MSTDWKDKAFIAQLKLLWHEGLSTSQIAKRMGISKNAIVGKAHRLNLPARPSPILRGKDGQPYQPKTQKPVRLAGAYKVPNRNGPVAIEAAKAAQAPQPRPLFEPPRVSKHPCCWPFGELGTPEFRFCEDMALNGKPYCQQHCDRAYVRIGDMRKDGA